MRALLFCKAEHRKRFVYQPVYHLPARGMYTNAQVFRSESKTKFHQTFGGGARSVVVTSCKVSSLLLHTHTDIHTPTHSPTHPHPPTPLSSSALVSRGLKVPLCSQYLCCFTMYSCERVHLSEGKFVQFSFSDLSPPLPPPLASCLPPLSLLHAWLPWQTRCFSSPEMLQGPETVAPDTEARM